MKDISRLKVGDWVKGRSLNGELIQGYIESLPTLHETAKVKVVKSDNEKIVGKTIETLCNLLKNMPMTTGETEEEIRGLIDIALITNDKTWFMDLTDSLSSRHQVLDGKKNRNKLTQQNRLGTTRF